MKTLISFLILLCNLNRDINLYFIRHAKGYHNQAAINFGFNQYENHEWFDAALTDEGISQAKELYYKIENIKPDLIYSSPFIRTIETLKYSLGNNFINVPILLDDNIRETINGHPCNYRHNKEFIINYTKTINRTFNYDNIIDFYRFNENIPDDLIIRGNKWFLNMLLYIKNKPDIKNIIIFTHGSFIKYLLNSYHFRKLNTNNNCKRYPPNVEICPILIKGV
jgi:broad specificity phosphatase PhoE